MAADDDGFKAVEGVAHVEGEAMGRDAFVDVEPDRPELFTTAIHAWSTCVVGHAVYTDRLAYVDEPSAELGDELRDPESRAAQVHDGVTDQLTWSMPGREAATVGRDDRRRLSAQSVGVDIASAAPEGDHRVMLQEEELVCATG